MVTHETGRQHHVTLDESAVAVQERFTLIIAIFATVGLVRSVVELAYPAPDSSYSDDRNASDADRERRAT